MSAITVSHETLKQMAHNLIEERLQLVGRELYCLCKDAGHEVAITIKLEPEAITIQLLGGEQCLNN